MKGYSYQQKVLFQHCDPAGIVFYPRYFEMINALVEHWFAESLNSPFAEMIGSRNTGMPTASITTNFHLPSRLGEELTFMLRVVQIGCTSLSLSIKASCQDQERLSAQVVLVQTNLTSGKPKPWTQEIRDAMSR
jgi:4-hydroxybenzoyl-CoA thioesterase